VTDSIRDLLARQKAGEAAKAKGEALLASLRGGEQVAGWTPVQVANRSQEGLEPAVLQALFRMAKPAQEGKPVYAGVSLGNGDYVLLRLDAVGQSQAELSEEEKANYRRFMASRAGQQDFSAYRRQLQEEADIERF